MRYSVIPVKTGIQSFQYLGRFWIPACAGMTPFYDFINDKFLSDILFERIYRASSQEIKNPFLSNERNGVIR